MLSQGSDPRAHRERKRRDKALEDARSMTFEPMAQTYHQRHKVKWHSAQYAEQWLRQLETHAFPKIGSRAIGAVDLEDIKRAIEPIWYDKPRAAQLVRSYIESVLNFAYVERMREADNNPARWDLLKHAFPERKGARAAGHFRALAHSDVRALLKELGEQADVISGLVRAPCSICSAG